ncbi:antigen peptide transporter 2a [Amia ocellicauda]|uniref:antigen peptide transporter 2a n=1 Tax=Amia ocellicauda TaxID=2972642 RepID=UPI003464BE68
MSPAQPLLMLRSVPVWGAALGSDLAVCVALQGVAAVLLPPPRSPFGWQSPARLWLLALARLAALQCVWGGRPVLRRCLATLALLAPLYESGRLALLGRPVESWSGALPDARLAALALAATAAACLFWELSLPSGPAGGSGQHRARVLFMRVVRYSRPDALYLGGAFLFLTVAVMCEMFIPYYTGQVIDILGSRYQQSSFHWAILCMGLFSVGSSLAAGLRGGLFMYTVSRLNKRVRLMLFQSLVKQDIGFFEVTKTGELTSRLSADTMLMSHSIAMNVNVLLRSVVKTLGVLALMLSLSWRMTLVTFIETPLLAVLQKIYNSYYERLAREVQDSVARANEAAGEAVSSIRTVRSFNTERSEARRYLSRLQHTHLLRTRRDCVRALYLLLRRMVSMGVKVMMLFYGRQLIQAGHMTTGHLVSFILYQKDMATHIRTLVYIYSNMLNSVGAAAKVFEYLDREPQVRCDGRLQPPALRGHVQFSNVTFCYPSRPDCPALKGVSLELWPGQVTALVGPSGGGKSTCVSLLERFYQPQEGQILLDGQLLDSYEHQYLHHKISMVGQEPVLFSGSIRDNISYGVPDCALDRVRNAADRANAHSFINTLERGYDTDVGERGGQLSGGQKQCIAIARALIRDPQILILDEATSCLDTDSEQVIQKALSSCVSQTVLLVAHRLKTVEKADQIILIDSGGVKERGSHQELMDMRGDYYRLRERLFAEDTEQSAHRVLESVPESLQRVQSSAVQSSPVHSSPAQPSVLQYSSLQCFPPHWSPVHFTDIQSSPDQSSPAQWSPVQFTDIQSSPAVMSPAQPLLMLRSVPVWGAALGSDLAVCVALQGVAAVLLPPPRSPFGWQSPARLWLLALARLAALQCVWGGRPVLRRCLATLALLAPLYESGRLALLGRPVESWSGALPDARLAALALAATAAACLFWELSLPSGPARGSGQHRARVLFMRVVRFALHDAWLLLGAFLFLTVAVMCEMFIPYYTGQVIDILGSQYQQSSFHWAILCMGLFSVGSSMAAGCRGGLFMCTISSFTRRMKLQLFRALLGQEIGFFEATKTGDITSRLATDTALMGRAVALNVNVLLRTLIRTAGMLALMVGLSWKLTLLVLMETPVTALMQNVYDTYYQRLAREVQDSVARANEAAGEAVSSIRTVRSFNTERSEARRYLSRLQHTHLLRTRRDCIRALYLLLRRLTSMAMQVAMLYYGRLFIQSGQMSAGNLVSFILYQMDLGDNIRTLIYIFGDMLNSVGAAAKVFEYLDREPQVCCDGCLQPPALRGHVQFSNVSFCYPSRPDCPALKGVSLELRPGQVTALVGPSGGGKSTCVSLLERFYQPQEGQILLDGQPLDSYEHQYLHRKISMVGQEPVLFSGSIRDNISYGVPDCALDRVRKAAERANAHGFINTLERGYDTDVGERGGQLSGGQKQCIAIARALIRDPQILILDEATSCLDTDSEQVIQKALSSCVSQTVLLVAHRLKTVEKADQIILIDSGGVKERGSHQELMDLRGHYYRLRERLFAEDTEQSAH